MFDVSEGPLEMRVAEVSPLEMRVTEVNAFKPCAIEVSVFEMRAAEVGALEMRSSKIGPLEMRATEDGTPEMLVAVLLGWSLVTPLATAQQPPPSTGAQGKTPAAPLQAGQVTMPADRVCVYAGQIYSIGSVLSGQRCQHEPGDSLADTVPPPSWVPINKGGK